MAKAAIEFTATVYKVQTLVDGGLRVTLDLPETAISEVVALMEAKRNEYALKINVKIEPDQRRGKARENIG